MNIIHPTAIIDKDATIGENISIGPYCVIGPDVKLADNVKLHAHVVVDGNTEIGEETEIFPFASIGTIPQDLKYEGEKSKLIIGTNNKIREHVTMNPGTQGGGMLTRIGNNCLFMVGSHIAHDCQIGNHVIMANNVTLAGHVIIENFVILGGLSAVHQFVRIGAQAMIGGMAGVEFDVIPFGMVTGERGSLGGLNLVGMKRRGLAKKSIHLTRTAVKKIFEGEGTLSSRVEKVMQDYGQDEVVAQIVSFIQAESSRGLTLPKSVQ